MLHHSNPDRDSLISSIISRIPVPFTLPEDRIHFVPGEFKIFHDPKSQQEAIILFEDILSLVERTSAPALGSGRLDTVAHDIEEVQDVFNRYHSYLAAPPRKPYSEQSAWLANKHFELIIAANALWGMDPNDSDNQRIERIKICWFDFRNRMARGNNRNQSICSFAFCNHDVQQ